VCRRRRAPKPLLDANGSGVEVGLMVLVGGWMLECSSSKTLFVAVE
jgi:hypothetical protein